MKYLFLILLSLWYNLLLSQTINESNILPKEHILEVNNISGVNNFHHKDVISISYFFYNNKVDEVLIQFDKNNSLKDQFVSSPYQLFDKWYDLTYKADSIMFHKLHPTLKIPEYPDIVVKTSYNESIPNVKYNIFCIELLKDKTNYRFILDSVNIKYGAWIKPAILTNIAEVERKIKRQLSNKTYSPTSLIYEMIINTAGKLDNLTLCDGENPEFANAIELALKKNAKWEQALQTSVGIVLNYRLRVLASLDKYGNVKLEFPKRQFNYTGD